MKSMVIIAMSNCEHSQSFFSGSIPLASCKRSKNTVVPVSQAFDK